MKLHEVPRNTKITVVGDLDKTVIDFQHIDGAFSYCEVDGMILNLHATTEVEIIEPT